MDVTAFETAASGGGHGLGQDAGGHGAVLRERAGEHPADGAGEVKAEGFAAAGLLAFSHQEAGAEDVEGVEAEGGERLLHFAFHAEIEVGGGGVGADAGDDHHAGGAGLASGAGEADDVVEVDLAEGVAAACLGEGGAETAEDVGGAGDLAGVESGEVVLAAQGADILIEGILAEDAHQLAAGEAGGPGDDGSGGRHGWEDSAKWGAGGRAVVQ